MMSKFVIKSVLSGLLLTTATFAYAAMDSNKVPCPSVKTMQQGAQKLDIAQKDEDFQNAYFVLSTNPIAYESKLKWQMVVHVQSAKSSNEAIKLAKEEARKTNILNAPDAEYEEGQYTCEYGPSIALFGLK